MKLENYRLNSIIDVIYQAFNQTHTYDDYVGQALQFAGTGLESENINGILISLHVTSGSRVMNDGITIIKSYAYNKDIVVVEADQLDYLIQSISILNQEPKFKTEVDLYFVDQFDKIIVEDFDNGDTGIFDSFRIHRNHQIGPATEEEAMILFNKIKM